MSNVGPGDATRVGSDRRRPRHKPKLLGRFDLDARALDCPAGGGYDLPVSADEVRLERPGEAIQGVVDVHHDANTLRRQEPARVVEGKPDPRRRVLTFVRLIGVSVCMSSLPFW